MNRSEGRERLEQQEKSGMLHAENEPLQPDNETMQARSSRQLGDGIERLQEENRQLRADCERLQAENERLRKELSRLRAAQAGAMSTRLRDALRE
jgi:predicted RNase H-like nuclease (RuvC/YqgF family)